MKILVIGASAIHIPLLGGVLVPSPLAPGFWIELQTSPTGTLLLAANWFIGLGWIAMAALEAAHRIRREEDALLETHGDAYREYMQMTGRVLPQAWGQRPGTECPRNSQKTATSKSAHLAQVHSVL